MNEYLLANIKLAVGVILGMVLAVYVYLAAYKYFDNRRAQSQAAPILMNPGSNAQVNTGSLGSLNNNLPNSGIIKPDNPTLEAVNNTPMVPSQCQVSEWSNWSKCSCLDKSLNQSRTRQILKNGENCPGLREEKPCDSINCPKWYMFNNSYISDGEYMNRIFTADDITCYSRCEDDPNCAAVNIYDGPEIAYLGPSMSKECSFVSSEKLPLLYNRYGSMTRFNPENRRVYVNQERAGVNFNSYIGSPI